MAHSGAIGERCVVVSVGISVNNRTARSSVSLMRTETDPSSGGPWRFWRAVRESLSGQSHDFTTGSLHRGIFLLAVPMILEMAMESIFAVVDMYFLGKLADSVDAIAAVGLTESVVTLLFAVAFGLSMATTATVARRIGEGDEAAASRAAFHAIVLGGIVSVFIAVPGVVFAPEILRWMEAEASVIENGAGYTRIILGSNVVILLLFLINAAFRGAGDPSIAMRSLWLANGINIVLDPCLIHGYGPFPALGVTGAAVASTVGRGSGVLYQCWCLRRGSGRLRLTRERMTLELAPILRLLKTSGGAVTQMLIATTSWMFLMRIVSGFGSIPVAGYTVAIRILVFSYLPMFGLTNAAATLVGQNLGAENPGRAQKSVWLTGAYTTAYTAMLTIVLVAFPVPFLRIFTAEADVIAVGVDALTIIAYGYVFYGWGMVLIQAFNGAGDTWTPTYINVFCFWALQIPLAYWLSNGAELGPRGVFWAVMLAEAVLTVVCFVVFRRGRWKSKAV